MLSIETCLDVKFMLSDPSVVASRIILRADLENNKSSEIRFSSVPREMELSWDNFIFHFP